MNSPIRKCVKENEKMLNKMPRRLLIIPVLVLTLVVGNSAFSADIQAGLDAAKRGDFVWAFRELKPFAEQGNADAQYNIGVMYRNGDGVSQEYENAIKWFELSNVSAYGTN